MKLRSSAISALVIGLTTLLGVAPLHAQRGTAAGGRAMQVDDLFTIESLNDVALSPDGEWLAVVIARPAADGETFNRPYLWGDERADVWLVSTDGEVRRNLTNGAADASGYWQPVWSPDGQRLAMLSTRGGDRIRLFVWERATDALRPLSARPVDLEAAVYRGAAVPGEGKPFIWLSPTELLLAALPDTAHSVRFEVVAQTPRIAASAWEETRRGRVAQVSVLESPVGVGDTIIHRAGMLVRVGVGNTANAATETIVGSLALEGSSRTAVVSPDNAYVAATEALFPRPNADERFSLTAESKARLGVFALDGARDEWWVEAAPLDPAGLTWSPDGAALAIIGSRPPVQDDAAEGSASEPKEGALYLVSPTERTIARGSEDGTSVMAVAWADGGVPLVFGTAPDSLPAPGWWALPAAGEARLLSTGITGASPSLLALESVAGEQLLMVADGDLWRLQATTDAPPTNLTTLFEPRIASVLWPRARYDGATDHLIIETEDKPVGAVYRLSLASGAKPTVKDDARLNRPAARAHLLDYNAAQQTAVFATLQLRGGYASPSTSDGPTLWATDADGRSARRLIDLNQQLDAIAEPETRFIRYRSLDGDSLVASITLPVGYQEGERVPVVVFVYAGSMVTDTLRPKTLLWKNSYSPLNLQPLVANGYAVLIPSMPLPPPPARADAYMELTKGVLPAIDELIDLGIAYPDRLAVMGQSFGGFSTYGLITQTTRFAAAIALAGPVDWISTYGIFDGRTRYGAVPQHFALPGIIEGFQPSLAASPWADLWAYLRNSPLYYLDRVETPLLIIQGDLDYVPMAQGELAFTAMQRMEKRARFVRYWGEEHVLSSPANVRDMWLQIFDWLDETMPVDQGTRASAASLP